MKPITTIAEFTADTALAALPFSEARLALLHLNAGAPMAEALDLASRFSRLTPEQQTAALKRKSAGMTLGQAIESTLANS